jgi:hypothetical protein
MSESDLVVAGRATAAPQHFATEVLAAVTTSSTPALYAQVDIAADADGHPVVMELEAIEPCLSFATAPPAPPPALPAPCSLPELFPIAYRRAVFLSPRPR